MGNNRHGLSRSPLFGVWAEMNSRIRNKNNKHYHNYGGRGIGMCADWRRYPATFVTWALKNGWEKGLVIDRVDNDGDYCPENCRFVTRAESNHNKRLFRKDNSSGYSGVSYYKRTNKWQSKIGINDKRKHLGYFDSPKLAAIRYDVEAFLLDDGRPMNFIEGVV